MIEPEKGQLVRQVFELFASGRKTKREVLETVRLGFAQRVLGAPARLWQEMDLDQKLRFQRLLFPEGVKFDGESFGTAVTSPVFSYLREISNEKEGVASPAGIEPVLSICFGRA